MHRACLDNTRLVLLDDVRLAINFYPNTRSVCPSSGLSIRTTMRSSPRLGSTWLVFRFT